MVTILLQQILDLLKGWVSSFTQYATDVMTKLNLIEEDTDNLSDIKSNTDDIKDNTGAVVTPIQSIQSSNTSIATDTTAIKNTVSGMSNQLTTISTNVGTASAFAEDCANNTLDIKDRVVTIGSDTTQLRSNSNTITADVSDIKTALNYYLANTPVTEDVEGSICNFDTDLADYLQACNVTIPSDLSGFSGITLTKNGKNLLDKNNVVTGYIASSNFSTGNTSSRTFYAPIKGGKTYTVNHTLTSRFSLATSPVLPTNGALFTNRITNNARNDLTITADINDNYIWIFCYLEGTDTKTLQEVADSLIVEVGETATEYEAYKAMTYPVSFGTTITDGAEINLLDGIIKVNSTPVSYLSISPVAIRTYKGINNIYSDIGTTALTYRETLKHYLDKQEE